MSKTQVGFVVTPGEIEGRIDALDRAIMALRAGVQASNAPRLNAPWRDEFEAFVRRWVIERDSYASWDAKLFATRVLPRIEAFELRYRQWAREFSQRTGSAAPLIPKRPSEGFFDVGGSVWLLAALGVVAFVWLETRRR